MLSHPDNGLEDGDRSPPTATTFRPKKRVGATAAEVRPEEDDHESRRPAARLFCDFPTHEVHA